MPQTRHRWLRAALAVGAAMALAGCGWISDQSAAPSVPGATTDPTGSATGSVSGPAPTPTASGPATDGPPSDRRRLAAHRTIGGAISPKSVVASRTGFVIAQNMMYRHSITVYDSDGELIETVSDAVRLAEFGVKGHPGVSRGAPVEAAFSPDGRFAYVSNYSMYGAGHGPEGSDLCTPSSARAAGVTPSFVYRIDMVSLRIDRVKKVGLVPKYVAVSPDGSHLLVTDWCGYDLRVIDTARWKQVAAIPMGAYPRGIAVSPDSTTAYVAVMGSSQLAVVDLRSNRVSGHIEVGSAPRHVVMAPDGRHLYATLNGANQVVKVDTRARSVVDRVTTGTQPRSMDIAPDGRSLYVVNYESNTVSKVRTRDLKVLQRISTGEHPIGITYEPTTDSVWVAVYTGAILVLRDR